MMTTATAVMLAEYSDWADRLLFAAMAGLPPGAPAQPNASLFGSMIGTLNHNYQVDRIWRAHLLGVPHGFTTRRDILHPELAELLGEQTRINQWYIDWARAQTAESLEERLEFHFVSGKAGKMSRGAMFLHIVNHKTYHRGWVAEMFFDHQVAPPETDLCVYLAE